MQYSQIPASPILEQTGLKTLVLEITNLRNFRGVINVALFNSPDGFPSDATKTIRCGQFPVTDSPLTIQFFDVPLGHYAVTVHHDENMDATLNCNALGIPKEGIGFSQNPRIWKGVPSFQRTVFEFGGTTERISIVMRYLLA